MFGPSIHKHCKVVKVDRRTANKNVSVTDLQRRNITELSEVVTNFLRVPRFRKKMLGYLLHYSICVSSLMLWKQP